MYGRFVCTEPKGIPDSLIYEPDKQGPNEKKR